MSVVKDYFPFVLLLIVIITLPACSVTHRQNSAKDSRAEILKNKQRVLAILREKGIKNGDWIAIESGNGSRNYYQGSYIARSYSWNSITLLTSKNNRNGSYILYHWTSISNVYTKDEFHILKRRNALLDNLTNAISSNDISKVKSLIISKDFSSIKPDLDELLFTTVETPNRAKIIRLLVKAGANADAKKVTFYYATPKTGMQKKSYFLHVIHHALDNFHTNNAHALIEAGASVSSRDANNRTPLMYAYAKMSFENDENIHKLKKFVDYLVHKKGIDRKQRFEDENFKADNILGINATALINLERQECFEILDKHKVKYRRKKPTGSVKYPVDVLSPIAGIHYLHTGNYKKFSVMDCRLVAALIGLSPVLKKNKVKTVYHMRTHAPGARISGRGRISGHHYALAIDISRFVTDNGTKYELYNDWKDRRYRAEVCKDLGSGSSKQQFLRNLICDAEKASLFHWMLTPHYNKAHHDHFHIELRSGIDYYMLN